MNPKFKKGEQVVCINSPSILWTVLDNYLRFDEGTGSLTSISYFVEAVRGYIGDAHNTHAQIREDVLISRADWEEQQRRRREEEEALLEARNPLHDWLTI